MNEKNLSNLTALGEGYTIEFKRSGTSAPHGGGREDRFRHPAYPGLVPRTRSTRTVDQGLSVVGNDNVPKANVTGGNPHRAKARVRQESRQKSRPKGVEQRILSILRHTPRSRSEISNGLGHKSVSGRLNEAIRLLMDDKLIEYTIPEKPNSRLQKYRLTENGKSRLAELEEGRS